MQILGDIGYNCKMGNCYVLPVENKSDIVNLVMHGSIGSLNSKISNSL